MRRKKRRRKFSGCKLFEGNKPAELRVLKAVFPPQPLGVAALLKLEATNVRFPYYGAIAAFSTKRFSVPQPALCMDGSGIQFHRHHSSFAEPF